MRAELSAAFAAEAGQRLRGCLGGLVAGLSREECRVDQWSKNLAAGSQCINWKRVKLFGLPPTEASVLLTKGQQEATHKEEEIAYQKLAVIRTVRGNLTLLRTLYPLNEIFRGRAWEMEVAAVGGRRL
ncbi:unnamed protein product, partial [Iphiclides podalirius]